jgi:putative hydrolase of the HAD superfamily
MPIDLICLDADDTLWHNMRFFHERRTRWCGCSEPFADAGIARSRWRLRDPQPQAVWLWRQGLHPVDDRNGAGAGRRRCAGSVIRDILEAGKALHAIPVELFEGVAIRWPRWPTARLVLVTKGDLFPPGSQARRLRPGRPVLGIEIVSDKKPDLSPAFQPQRRGAGQRADGRRFDAHRHASALEAGAWAAYIPQPLAWSHEQRPAPPIIRASSSCPRWPRW